MPAIYDDARADALVAQGVQGLMERLGLCKEIMQVRAKLQGLSFNNIAAQERAKALAQRRINAVRAVLLPSFKATSTSAAVDELLIPATAKATLEGFINQASQGSEKDRASASLLVSDLVVMMRRINSSELDLGLTNRSQNFLDIAEAAQKLLADDPEGTPEHLRGRMAYKPILDAALEAGKFSQEQLDMAKAAADEALKAKDASSHVFAPEEAAEFAAMSGKWEIYKSQINELTAAMNSAKRLVGRDSESFKVAQAKYEVLYEEYLQWHRNIYNKRGNELLEIIKAKRSDFLVRSNEVLTKLMDDINKDNPVTVEVADKWANEQVHITPAAVARLRKIKYPADKVRKDFAEFYRFVRGRVDKLVIDTRGDTRANATDINVHGHAGNIYLDSTFNKVTLWHEAGHHIEADPAARAAAGLYIRLRSENNGALHSMRALTGYKGYHHSEVALKGGFFTPYVGKVYRDGFTEVFSMACETFADPGLLASRMAKDPQTLEFVMGYIKSPKTALQQLHQSMRESMRETTEGAQEQIEATLEKRKTELAGSVQLENIDPAPWLEREGAGWLVERNGAQYIGGVKAVNGDTFYVYSSKRVRNPATKRYGFGYIAYRDPVVKSRYLNEHQIPVKEKASMLAVMAVWAKSTDGYPDASKILSGRA